MNLFNIGVDGQYRLAAFCGRGRWAAVHAAQRRCTSLVIVVVAMLVGAMWAGIAGLLKVTRGVSEVISTIMLNAIATGLIAFLLRKVKVDVAGSNNIGTKPHRRFRRTSRASRWSPAARSTSTASSSSRSSRASATTVLLSRTRFGFDLRATGQSESAAVASGVNVEAHGHHVDAALGRVAGLVGMPQLLGASYTYSLDFPAGLGFTGIAVALLGRNHPVGIAFGALLFGVPRQLRGHPRLNGIPKEIVADHAGHDRALGRRRLRAGPALSASRPSSDGSAASSPANGPPSARRCAHEHDVAGPTPAPGRLDRAAEARRRSADPAAASCSGWPAADRAARLVGAITGRRRPHVAAARSAPPWRSPCRSAWPASAGCGPSAPAW